MSGIRGHSDRINHALAFAAKHHDKQVRKGTALPYQTQPANVAVILTRYGCSEPAVVGGILQNAVEDSVRDGQTNEDLEERIGAKFGSDVLYAVLSVSERKVDDSGVDLSVEEREDDLVERLADAPDVGRWICAADMLYRGSVILADLRRTAFPETVWGRNPRGAAATVASYRRIFERLGAVGFKAPIMTEVGELVSMLEDEAAKIHDAK